MKFTVVVTIININEQTFSLLDSISSQSIDDFEVILCIPNIFIEKNVDKLRSCIKNLKNITFLELQDDNVNFGRNQAILNSNSEYIIFINSNENVKKLNFLELVYSKMKKNNLEILTYDFTYIEKYEKDTSEIDDIKQKEINNSRKRLLEEKVYKGSEFYNKLIKKELFFDYLFTYSYKTDFLKDNNLIFDERLGNNTLLFITKSLILCENLEYIAQHLMQEHRYNCILTNYNFLKYNWVGYIFNTIDELLKIISKYERIDIKISIINQIVTLLLSVLDRIKENKQYNYIDKVFEYLKDIKLLLTEEDYTEIEIKIDMIIDAFQTYERYKSDNIKHRGKNIYNDIYMIQEVINNINNSDDYMNNIKILHDILKNSHYLKFKSVDILNRNLKNINDMTSNIEEFKINLRNLQKDIESIAEEKFIYYGYFEDKFDEVLKSI